MQPRQSAGNGRAVFELSAKQASRGLWMLIGGIGLVLVALAGFVFVLLRDVDQLTLHSLSTLPMIMAVGLLTGGWNLIRGPRRVVLDAKGLEVDGRRGRSRHAWSDMGWSNVDMGMSRQRVLTIYGRSGGKLVTLSDAFSDFDRLVKIVQTQVADRADEETDHAKLKKTRRNAILMGGFGILMVIGGGFIAWTTWDRQRSAALLESGGIEGEAVIDELLVAPNGRTKRVRYTVTNASGETGSRSAEVESDYYEELKNADAEKVAVLFVPDEPAISRLSRGEVIDDDFTKTSVGGYGMTAVSFLIFLFLFSAATLQWRGWDLDFNSKTGKLSIKPVGEGE